MKKIKITEKRIKIYSIDSSKGDYGEDIDTETEYCSTNAAVYIKSGDEIISDNAIVHPLNIEFTIRYRSGITTDMQIEFEDNRYKILFIEKIERNKWLKLHSTKILDGITY